jgi:hypothetical protein
MKKPLHQLKRFFSLNLDFLIAIPIDFLFLTSPHEGYFYKYWQARDL